jgi:hypothetical protein
MDRANEKSSQPMVSLAGFNRFVTPNVCKYVYKYASHAETRPKLAIKPQLLGHYQSFLENYATLTFA